MNTSRAAKVAFDGATFRPGDAGFDDALRTNNQSLTHRPTMLVAAESTDDVVRAVRLAADRGESVGVQASGHGMSVASDGVLVSTRGLAHVAVDADARRARLGAGARWGDVLAATVPHGLAPLHGSSPAVAAAGFTTGGGVGPLGRLHGYGADRVDRLQVVTADAGVHDLDAADGSDLFWGVRGAKGNLGLVTELEVELFEVEDFLGGGLYLDGTHADEILPAYLAWADDNARETSTSLLLVTFPDVDGVAEPLRGRPVVHLRFAHFGDPDEAARRLEPMRHVAPILMDTVDLMSYADIASIHHDPDGPYETFESGFFTTTPGGAQVTALTEAAAGPPMVIELRHHAGAYADPPDVPNPVRGRNADYTVYLGSMPQSGDTEPERAQHRRIREAFADTDRGTVINFLGVGADPAWVRDAFEPADLERLLRLKADVDPGDVFRVNHNLTASGA